MPSIQMITLCVRSMPSSAIVLSCDSCNMNKAASAPRNRTASQKHAAPLEKFSCDLWGPVHVLSPYGLRHCLLAIEHHTNYMWVRFMKSKDKTCSKLESILLDARNTHAMCHSQHYAFAPFIKFDSDSLFEAYETQLMCTSLGFSTHFSAPYAHHMLGKAERLWGTLRDYASSMLHAMCVPTSMCRVRSTPLYTYATAPSAELSALTLLTGTVHDASTFRVFGCVVFATVLDNLIRKLGLKAFLGVMVGYSQNSPGYRVYNPATRRITTSVHVKF
jgi:hypothetical protein